VGLLPRADYLNLLAISCAHVYLTYPFVLSWSLIEAMSAGCCIVASDTAPVREVIADGKNGRLVRFFDRSALSETVCEVLAAPDRFANLRQQARADAIAAFDLQTVCLPRLVSLAEQTANSPKQS
jgi:glycosyltransferase involved in cell wall biosynthesis